MVSTYKISIILPIFNVKSYLQSALDSILNQTIDINKLEIIMVDDCSTDGSSEIIDEYSKKYDNFIAIHLDNNSGSAGKPRNIGLEKSQGEYVIFLDPDDEFSLNICEILLEEIENNDADLVTGNALCIMENIEVIDIHYQSNFREIYPNNNLNNFKPFRIWGTIFKKSFLEEYKISFINVATNEDTYFCYKCFFNANKIIYLNDLIGVKHYERSSDEFLSLTHNFSKNNIISTIEAFKEISNLIDYYNPKNNYEFDPFIGNIYWRFANNWNMNNKDKKEIFKKVLEYENNSKYNINLPIHYKIMDFFLKYKLFNVLIVIQKIYSIFVWSKFSRKFLIPKIQQNIVK